MPSRTEAINRFLIASGVTIYNPDMEVQVNVAQDNGTRIEGDYQGRKWHGWTDGLTTWKSFRIPYDAKNNPHYDDPPMNFDLESHVEGIGMTGWDWKNQVSKWVAFDFDSIIGHKTGLKDSELSDIKDKASAIPWVSIKKSTSGKGIHIYVYVDIHTANHNEHAALARSILGLMSSITGFDFSAHVDTCGGNIWVWHRKQKNTDGFSTIKQGTILSNVPINWKDHIPVIKGTRKKIKISDEESDFDQIIGQYIKIPLDQEHKRLIDFLSDKVAWWDTDHHILVTHTIHLKEAHTILNLKGLFETNSSHSTPHNVFCCPLNNGSWVIRRFGQGVQEHDTWDQDSNGWTRCFFNREPDLKSAARAFNGLENPKGGFHFNNMGAENIMHATHAMGIDIGLPNWILNRDARILPHKDGRVIVEIKANPDDKGPDMQGWLNEKGYWVKIFNHSQTQEPEIQNFDHIIRHVVTEGGDDYGWVVKSDNIWRREPLQHVMKALKSMGYNAKEIDQILGSSIFKCWTIVNKPFQPEYPGDRQWNKDAAQLRFIPSNKENLNYPTWLMILNHCGFSLNNSIIKNDWCKQNAIISGADYLKCWIASALQYPTEPLPYLFFWGPQNSGKSVFHEAIELLITGGYARADNALLNSQGFNSELANAIFCVVEEVDLNKSGSIAYNRIKDWTTSRLLPVHAKNHTPYSIRNTTHWCQCSNSPHACPIFSGDSRITMIFVDKLEKIMPKRDMFNLLEKEAPDFLRSLLDLEIPLAPDRLNLPVIITDDKLQSIENNRSPIELFIEDKCFYAPGEMIPFTEFYDTFINWLEPERKNMFSKIRVGRDINAPFIKGRDKNTSQFMIGNMSWKKPDISPTERYILFENKLILEEIK